MISHEIPSLPSHQLVTPRCPSVQTRYQLTEDEKSIWNTEIHDITSCLNTTRIDTRATNLILDADVQVMSTHHAHAMSTLPMSYRTDENVPGQIHEMTPMIRSQAGTRCDVLRGVDAYVVT